MSEGLMCLNCRKYYLPTNKEWACQCAEPRLSVDGITVAPLSIVKAAIEKHESETGK